MIFLEFFRPAVQQKQLAVRKIRIRAVRVISRAVMQGCRIIIGNPAEFRNHQLPEKGIDGIQYLGPASEILKQINPERLFTGTFLCFPTGRNRLPLLLPLAVFSLKRRIRVVLFQKKIRPGLAKSVNGLLDIAHHKTVVPPFLITGNSSQQRLLDVVAVLIFINHNSRIAPGKLSGHIRPAQGSILCLFQKNPERKMFQIRKITEISFPLFLSEGSNKVRCQLYQFLHKRIRILHLLQNLLEGPGKILSTQYGNLIPDTVMAVLDLFL